MEDPDQLRAAVLRFATARAEIVAVVETGARARGRRVDAFSDLDIELIGPGAPRLAGADGWQAEIAPALVSIHLDNQRTEPAGEPAWPTCLVVFEGGRKVDFTLAGTERLERMARDGLDETYRRGYVVHLDRLGLARGLPPAPSEPPLAGPPSAAAFAVNQREFWFEATQVPIYAARGELWPAQSRLGEMRDLLLEMLQWRAAAAGPAVDTWYHGYHLAEWLDAPTRERLAGLFAAHDAGRIVEALRAAIDLYAETAAETGAALSLPVLALADPVIARLDAVLSAG